MRWLIPWMAGCCLAWTGAAQSVYNPNLLPLGDRESLMANTGTGGLKSTGAVFYNPGALATLEGDRLSLSGSAYMRFRFEAAPIVRFGESELDYRGAGLRSIPTSVIAVRRLGDWTFGLGILVPMTFAFEGERNWTLPFDGANLDLKLLQNYQESISLYGLTTARALGKGWFAGLSLYAQLYRYLSTIDLRGSLREDPTRVIQQTFRERRRSVNVLFMAGVLKQWEKVSLGLRITAPSLVVFGDGDYYEYFFNQFANPTETQRMDFSGTRARFISPLDLRLGGVIRPGNRWEIAMDLSYAFPVSYRVFPDIAIESEENTRGNFRLSGGCEFHLRKTLSLLGGASYTPSTLLETEEEFGQNFWSIHLAGKYNAEQIQTGAGLFFIRGQGEGPLPSGGGRSSQLYENVGFVLSTNYRF